VHGGSQKLTAGLQDTGLGVDVAPTDGGEAHQATAAEPVDGVADVVVVAVKELDDLGDGGTPGLGGAEILEDSGAAGADSRHRGEVFLHAGVAQHGLAILVIKLRGHHSLVCWRFACGVGVDTSAAAATTLGSNGGFFAGYRQGTVNFIFLSLCSFQNIPEMISVKNIRALETISIFLCGITFWIFWRLGFFSILRSYRQPRRA